MPLELTEDDDDPSHCFFYQVAKCKCAVPTYKPPSTTNWIGCECLGLEFSSDSEKERYAFVCQSHDNVNELDLFRDRVTVSSSDTSMLEEEEKLTKEAAPSKIKTRSTYRLEGEPFTEQHVPPNYVEYEGEYYHIGNFLSLQQGKVYNPSTSRMTQWMAVARNDFYERIEGIVNPVKTTTGLYLNDISAFLDRA